MGEKQRNILVGLDVGTTKVCTIVGIQNSSGDIEVIGMGSSPSLGLKKGSVVNIEKTIESIRASVEEARLACGMHITHANVGIAGNHIYSFNSSGVVAVKGQEITKYDVARAINAAKAVVLPEDREILHVITQSFSVDHLTGIKDPIGMCGTRLEVHIHVVTGAINLIQNLIKCVESAGVKVDHITLQPVASSAVVLSKEEKELGVVLVDIGGGTTDVAIWKNDSLLHSQIIPVGGNHFTNDLAQALKVPFPEAEKIKIHHGDVLVGKINPEAHLSLQGLKGMKAREYPLHQISEILAARAEEIFSTLLKILEEKNLLHEMNGGVVLTGGGAQLKSMPELGEFLLDRPIRIGHPLAFEGTSNNIRNPKFSTVLGLLLILKTYAQEKHKSQSYRRKLDVMSRFSDSLKSVLREIF